MKNHTKYLFHNKMRLLRCSEGVLSCYIMGNKISLFERSIDSDFSSFILHYLRKPFSVKDMENFFSKELDKYNFGMILQELKKHHLIHDIDTNQTPYLLINFTDIPNKTILNISKEFNQEHNLKFLNDLKNENKVSGDYSKNLSDIKEDQVIFVLSDFQHKYKVFELNLYFLKKGMYWCPIMIDQFGGYIGPLIHSIPSGPCFNCYEEKLYPLEKNIEEDSNVPDLSNIFLRVALWETLKISTNAFPSPVMFSHLLEIDCFNHRSRKHYIYTNSSCTVCGL